MFKFPVAAVTAALLTVGTPALATVYTATWTGHLVSNSYDLSGMFGSPYTDLRGLPFKAVVLIDDGVAGANIYQSGIGSQVSGAGTNTPTITINGRHQTVGNSTGFTSSSTYNAFDNYYTFTGDAFSNFLIYATASAPYQFLPNTFYAPILQHDVLFTNDAYGSFDFYRANGQRASGTFQPEHLTVALAAVPDAPAWALLMMGFGLTGATLRRRATSVAA